MGQKHERNLSCLRLEFGSKGEDILVTYIVHADDHIDVIVLLYNLAGLSRGCYPYEFRWITQIKIYVFLVDLGLDLSVLFKYKSVIVTADHQDLPDSELDK